MESVDKMLPIRRMFLLIRGKELDSFIKIRLSHLCFKDFVFFFPVLKTNIMYILLCFSFSFDSSDFMFNFLNCHVLGNFNMYSPLIILNNLSHAFYN